MADRSVSSPFRHHLPDGSKFGREWKPHELAESNGLIATLQPDEDVSVGPFHNRQLLPGMLEISVAATATDAEEIQFYKVRDLRHDSAAQWNSFFHVVDRVLLEILLRGTDAS